MMTDSTTPHTPSQKSRSLPPDTLPVVRHTSLTDYQTGDLRLGRLAVLADLKRYMKVPFDNLAKCISAESSSRDLQRMHDKLVSGDVLIRDSNGLRWKKFTSPVASKAREDKAFDPLGDIISKILEEVQGCALSFKASPNATPISERNNTSRPDGYLIREDEETGDHWFNIAVPFEFKKAQVEAGIRDDEQKIIWSLHNIMREDPCRRFAYGITMEGTQLRLWLSNRALVAVSEAIDFFTDIDRVISLFCALGSASTDTTMKGLGWDPTVERIRDGNKYQYKFTVGGEVFTTIEELATYGADSMVGRGTRVYKAQDATGKEVAIKDSWRDATRQSEGKILEDILVSFQEKLSVEEVAEAEEHFVRVRLWEDVKIDNDLDGTLDPTAGEGGSWTWVAIDYKPVLSEKKHLPSTGNVPDAGRLLSAFLPTRIIGPEDDGIIPRRVHTRTVFHDVGKAVKDITSLADILSCLSGGLKALRLLHKAGWLHRDFSVGNVIWVVDHNGGIGKLTDFEYAKRVNCESTHDDVRTGTVHFMAVEVDAQQYLFDPPVRDQDDTDPSLPHFRMNCLHDIESVWWAFVWFFFYHTDTNSADPNRLFDVHAQWKRFQLGFPGAIGQSSRQNFFMKTRELSAACRLLSRTCQDVVRGCIRAFAETLVMDGYPKAYQKYPPFDIEHSLLEATHEKAADYLAQAQQRASGIELYPLPGLLTQKRRRTDGEISPTQKSSKIPRVLIA